MERDEMQSDEEQAAEGDYAGSPPLSDCDRDIFLSLLDAPPEPNEVLRRAAREYARRVISTPRVTDEESA